MAKSFDQLVADSLLKIGTGQVDYWTRMLRPVRDQLKPHLERRFGDRRSSPAIRQFSSTILALLFRDDPDVLARLAIRGDGSQQREFVNSLKGHKAAAIRILKSIEEPLLEQRKLDENARQSLVASTVVRFQLGDELPLWSRLVMTADPSVRTELFLQLQSFGVPLQRLVDQLNKENPPSCRQALLLALGEYSPDGVNERSRKNILELVRQIVKSPQTTPGTHVAAKWLLREWGQELPTLTAVAISRTPGRRWWMDSQGHTMLVVPARRSFRMGSPIDELGRNSQEDQRDIPMPRPLAVSMCEVTVEQFRRFRPLHRVDGSVCPVDTCPVTAVSWYDAVQYCRWLSGKEGLKEEDMVYPSLDTLDLNALHQPAAKMPDKLFNLPKQLLSRTGYRLPTSVEWEYLSRAGSQTRFCFGENDAHLSKFAWTALSHGGGQRTNSVGLLRPNAWGLLDVAGNVGEWTHDHPADPSAGGGVSFRQFYLRGGLYRSGSRSVRSARLITYPAQSRYSFTGFRIVRTLSSAKF